MGWLDLAVEVGTGLAAGYFESEAQKEEAEGREKGAEEQARVEGLSQDYSAQLFQDQIARQQPYLDVGTRALPLYQDAIANRGNVSGLPATQIQGDMISDFIAKAPDFVKNRAINDLEAIELEKNKGRLSNLINIGLGGVGSSAGSSINLGSTLGTTTANIGNIQGQALSQAAVDRANLRNTQIGSLSALPGLAYDAYSAYKQPTTQNPLITAQNPLGLTSGQGL